MVQKMACPTCQAAGLRNVADVEVDEYGAYRGRCSQGHPIEFDGTASTNQPLAPAGTDSKAVDELLEAGKVIPGTKKFNGKKVSCTKVS